MSYETMMYIGIGVSVVMFVLSVILFVQLHIPRVIGGLSGYSARKEIETIREQNIQSGKKGYQTSPYNRARGKLTTPLGQRGMSGTLSQITADLARVINKTETLETPPTQSTANATTVLQGAQAADTTLLREAAPQTSLLEPTPTANETTVLGADVGATTLLSSPQAGNEVAPQQSFAFIIEVDQTEIHTDEQISSEE